MRPVESYGNATVGAVTVELPPVPGIAIDPPPKDFEATVAKLDARHRTAGLAFRTGERFLYARGPLLAAGTTYYLFLSLISLVAFAYGLVALFGADQAAEWLTEALNAAFPGLLGPSGIDPQSLRDYGSASSLVGLAVLAFSGTGAVNAASQSLHLINGAPKDPRNYVLARIRMVGQLMVVGPIILASFIPSVAFATLTSQISDALGIADEVEAGALFLMSTAAALLLDFAAVYLMLSWMGGIRPPRRARIVGAAAGSIVIEALKFASAAIIAWSLSKPQYGAFAVPITTMLVLYLLSIALYLSASLTAALAIRRAERILQRQYVDSASADDPLEPERARGVEEPEIESLRPRPLTPED